jgi:hypothetical protein
MRFVGREFFRRKQARPFKTILKRSLLQSIEPRKLCLISCHDQLAAAAPRDAAFLCELLYENAAPGTESGAQGARLVVDTGMDDTTVAAALMRRNPALLLQKQDASGGLGTQDRTRHPQSY